MLRFVSAGSVDDGESTLIGRLLYDSRALQVDLLAGLEHASARRAPARLAEVLWWLDVSKPEERPADTGVATNDIVRARFVLQEPLFVDSYATVRVTGAFILIDGATNSTVAAGMVS